MLTAPVVAEKANSGAAALATLAADFFGFCLVLSFTAIL